MTQEVQNQIIGQFWGIVPYAIIGLLIAAVVGIGYKILEKKLMRWAKKKKAEKDQKNADK